MSRTATLDAPIDGVNEAFATTITEPDLAQRPASSPTATSTGSDLGQPPTLSVAAPNGPPELGQSPTLSCVADDIASRDRLATLCKAVELGLPE